MFYICENWNLEILPQSTYALSSHTEIPSPAGSTAHTHRSCWHIIHDVYAYIGFDYVNGILLDNIAAEKFVHFIIIFFGMAKKHIIGLFGVFPYSFANICQSYNKLLNSAEKEQAT